MRLGLFVGQLGLRGTDQFVLKLADVCERELGHSVTVVTHADVHFGPDVTPASQHMFRSRFHTVGMASGEDLDAVAARHGLQAMYVSKWGVPDALQTHAVPCIVHAIFECATPHGDVYVAISDHMRQKAAAPCGVLPFCVELAPPGACLRRELGIPADAVVFGRHGGYRQFDVPFVQQAVRRAAAQRAAYFLFLNTQPFMPGSAHVHFLPARADLQGRSDFVRACDAMVHGRSDGETFSMACGEFSLANKPVITTDQGDQAHVAILRPNVFVASDADQFHRHMQRVAAMPRPYPEAYGAYRQYDRAALAARFRGLLAQAVTAFQARRHQTSDFLDGTTTPRARLRPGPEARGTRLAAHPVAAGAVDHTPQLVQAGHT